MTTSLTITERAARRIGQILKTEGDGTMLRISVEGGGCSGFQYKFNVERNQADDDTVIEKGDVKVIMDSQSAPLLQGAEVDYVDSLQGSGFSIKNPQAKTTCGCSAR